MKKIICLISLSLTLNAFGKSDLDEKCIREADNFGGQSLISTDCEKWMIKNAEIKQVSASFELYAWKSVSILKTVKGMFIVAGDNSLLGEILDIKIDQKLETIAILNQTKIKKQILIFSSRSNGDVAPSLVIEGPEVSLIKKISFKDNFISGTNESSEWKWDLSKDSRVVGDIRPASVYSFDS